jgi:hypothetical protein
VLRDILEMKSDVELEKGTYIQDIVYLEEVIKYARKLNINLNK